MIGVDIISIKRFQNLTREDLLHWNKFFNQDEWEYCFTKPDPAQHLAGIFAAKEAVMKALRRVGMAVFGTITIGHEPDGAPTANIVDSDMYVDISISHDSDMAVAVAVVSKKHGQEVKKTK